MARSLACGEDAGAVIKGFEAEAAKGRTALTHEELMVWGMMINCIRTGDRMAMLGKFVSPLFSLLGIPNELAELLILRPLSGSGSLAVLEGIYEQYGVDSYISRSASVIMGSSDTVLYIAAVYFSGYKENGTRAAVPIALAVTFLGAIAACLVCRFL